MRPARPAGGAVLAVCRLKHLAIRLGAPSFLPIHGPPALSCPLPHPLRQVRILLNRPCHAQEGFSLKGTAVRAFTPSNPEPQDEAWYAFLTDPGSNFVLTWAKVRPAYNSTVRCCLLWRVCSGGGGGTPAATSCSPGPGCGAGPSVLQC